MTTNALQPVFSQGHNCVSHLSTSQTWISYCADAWHIYYMFSFQIHSFADLSWSRLPWIQSLGHEMWEETRDTGIKPGKNMNELHKGSNLSSGLMPRLYDGNTTWCFFILLQIFQNTFRYIICQTELHDSVNHTLKVYSSGHPFSTFVPIQHLLLRVSLIMSDLFIKALQITIYLTTYFFLNILWRIVCICNIHTTVAIMSFA